MEYYDTVPSPLGDLYLKFTGKVLTGICFARPKAKAGKAPESLKSQMKDYFEGRLRRFRVEISFVSGTEFEKNVWLSTSKIPYGETRTYKWVAEKIGCPKGPRAVGQALSKNPIPIVVPCHRVVESQGKIGGYSSGEDIKRRLLSLEYYHTAGGQKNSGA